MGEGPVISKLRVLGHEYRVIADPNLNEQFEAGGLALISQNEIRYDPGYSLSQIREVILHEAVEIINASLDLSLEHSTIQSLACSIQQLLADNPRLLSLFRRRRSKNDALD